MKIAIGNTKGGTGKSTIATNLAVCAAAAGLRVALVDSDVQESSAGWHSLREKKDIGLVTMAKPVLHERLDKLQSDYDLLIIDTGGRDSGVFRSALVAADLVIIPTLPGVYDLWAAAETIQILGEARKETRKPIPARLLLNQLQPNTIIGRETQESLEEYTQAAPLLEMQIHARQAYKRAVIEGKGVIEVEPRGKAAFEMLALYSEIKNLLGR